MAALETHEVRHVTYKIELTEEEGRGLRKLLNQGCPIGPMKTSVLLVWQICLPGRFHASPVISTRLHRPFPPSD